MARMIGFVSEKEENIVGKGGNAGYQHFPLFSHFRNCLQGHCRKKGEIFACYKSCYCFAFTTVFCCSLEKLRACCLFCDWSK